jgi:hypothetical protein
LALNERHLVMAKTSRIVGPDGQPIEMDLLDQEISAPSIAGIRQPWHASVATGLTPSRLAQILSCYNAGDLETGIRNGYAQRVRLAAQSATTGEHR